MSFKDRMTTARNLDKIPLNQIERLKSILRELETTEHRDTIGFANYFIAYRYAQKVKPINPDSAVFYANQALVNFKLSNYTEIRNQKALNYLIYSYNSLEQYSKAINAYQRYDTNYLITDKNVRVQSQIVRKISKSYRSLAEYEAGLNFINTFLKKNYKLKIPDDELSNIYLEKSIVENKLNLTKSALASLNRAFRYEENSNKKSDINRLVNLTNQKALLYFSRGNFDEALELYNLYLTKNIGSKERFTLLSNAYNSFYEAGQYKLAAPYAKQAFDLNSEFDNSVQNTFASVFNLSESYRILNQIDTAIYYGNYGIKYLLDQKEKGTEVNLFLLKQYHNQVLNFISLFDHNNQPASLDSARVLMSRVNSLLPSHLENLLFEGSLLRNKQEIAQWYDTGVVLANKLNSPELFIQYSDQTKSLSLLSESVVDKENIILRDSIQNELQSLISKESQLQLSINISSTDSLLTSLLNNREKQRVLKTSLKSIAQNNQIKEAVSLSGFNDPDVSILYYHQTDSIIYASHISHNFNQLVTIGKLEELITEVSTFNDEIRNKNYNVERAKFLYNWLVNPFKNLSNKLVIIPDQELSLFPFEALITSNESYLLEEREISYALSFQHYLEANSFNNESIDQIKIVSPDYDDSYTSSLVKTKGLSSLDKQFSFLKYTKDEVKYLEDNLSASSIQGFDISRDTFFSLLSNADIFHFTGHAISLLGNDRLSFLALGRTGEQVQQDIFIREIAEHKTDASLVTLNACNTGVGKVLKGEGVYNLARSFFKAGAKAVLSGLWEIEDFSSSEITKSFYSYLKAGKSKSKALQLAKLDYLNNVKLDSQKDPYYWAGLILTGNTKPLYRNWSTSGYFFGGLVLLIVLSIVSRKIYLRAY